MRDGWKLARELFGLVWGAARWQMVAAVALATALSLTEGVGLAALFPLIALLGGGGNAGLQGHGLRWCCVG